MDLVDLGAFLKTRRDRIRPGDVGLTTGPRRRVPGLRREEVAYLAGASTDYYTELERGGGARPSDQMLTALARALRLSSDERNHLFHLAGYPSPPPRGPLGHVHPAMLALLDRLEDTPARIMTDLHEPLAQNRLGATLLGPLSEVRTRPYGSSFVYVWFTRPEARSLYPVEDHPRHSRDFVADLRAVAARRGDPEIHDMITELRGRSEEFAALWAERDVALRRHATKRLVHPTVGVIELDCHTLFSEDGCQRLLWLAARPGSPAAGQLALLAVVGTQRLPASGMIST
ncbi:helix-turn-helix transcriptional regulator [Rhodococcus sp. NPDC058639]|uniref:helix-turn-helix transcriptional regulator n=1 Tax=unclassified Rhodococcus (in: high G+C Gram-positive bacteria) TaxID=192944 RepID=UPI00365E5EEC